MYSIVLGALDAEAPPLERAIINEHPAIPAVATLAIASNRLLFILAAPLPDYSHCRLGKRDPNPSTAYELSCNSASTSLPSDLAYEVSYFFRGFEFSL
jgi:hypothetical protein